MNWNETSKESRRFFAISSLGKSRWYWVVWPSLSELQASTKPILHIADGVEKTKAEAVEKALELAGRYATWIPGKYARAYHQSTKTTTVPREGHPRKVESTALPNLYEFLYRDIFDVAARMWISVPHRIVRRTRRYVFVEQRPSSSEKVTGSWLDGEQPVYRLDRQTLEQQGYAFIPATADLSDHEEPVFFISGRDTWQGIQLPSCLQVLGLSWPCTLADVQDAYRKLVRSAHPDGGGSHEKFIELQAAYEQALRLCR